MSYEMGDRRTYVFPLYDYGGASGARVDKIRGPKGKAGRLIDYGVQSILEDFAGTTSATIAVGTAADPDAYGNELALNGGLVTSGGRSVQSLYDPNGSAADRAAHAALMLEPDLPADTAIYITNTEAITNPTGQACPYVTIQWDW
jgi:hypothetical protein